MNSHDKVLDLILKSEGGLNEDEPEHVGGVSYAGITQQAYNGWITKTPNMPTGFLPKSVKELSEYPETVHAFYEDYFTKYHVWELPECLQYIFADFVVNAGSAAVKIIQRFAEVDDDGLWGSGTSLAVSQWKANVEVDIANDPHADNNLIMAFHEQKLAHYQFLVDANPEKYGRYHEGWKRRANNVLSDLGHYFENDEPTPKAIDEDDEVLKVETPLSETDFIEPTPELLAKIPTHILLDELKRRTGI